jgi:hypothetical protein
MAVHFTREIVRRARYTEEAPKRCVIWSVDIPGFGLRVYPTGRKVWILSYRDRYGKKRLKTIASTDELTPGRALKAARELYLRAAVGEVQP